MYIHIQMNDCCVNSDIASFSGQRLKGRLGRRAVTVPRASLSTEREHFRFADQKRAPLGDWHGRNAVEEKAPACRIAKYCCLVKPGLHRLVDCPSAELPT